MKLLFCGDIVGRSGRDAVEHYVPILRKDLGLDAVIANVDNAAGGFGITKEVCNSLLQSGVDILTSGDHLWDQKGAAELLEQQPKLLRPHNFPPETPGSGCRIFTLDSGKRLMVLHLLGQVFHKEYLDSPFRCAAKALEAHKLGDTVDAILVDMHAEATSEKQAMGIFLDGKVSAMVGSHTHVPTADAKILQKGTAYQTDVGMCGDYHQTIIGFQPAGPMEQFWGKRRKIRMEPGKGAGTLKAVYLELDDKSGFAKKIEPISREMAD